MFKVKVHSLAHWTLNTHTTGCGKYKKNENLLQNIKISWWTGTLPAFVWTVLLLWPFHTRGVPSCIILSSLSHASPIFMGLSPSNLMMSLAPSDGSTWVVREDVLPLHTVELTNCRGVSIPSEAVVVVMQNLNAQEWETVGCGEGAPGWTAYSDRMSGIYLWVLIWWEMCCLTCTWENGGRVSVAVKMHTTLTASCSSL